MLKPALRSWSALGNTKIPNKLTEVSTHISTVHWCNYSNKFLVTTTYNLFLGCTILGVGSCMEELLEWLNYPCTRAHPGSNGTCIHNNIYHWIQCGPLYRDSWTIQAPPPCNHPPPIWYCASAPSLHTESTDSLMASNTWIHITDYQFILPLKHAWLKVQN